MTGEKLWRTARTVFSKVGSAEPAPHRAGRTPPGGGTAADRRPVLRETAPPRGAERIAPPDLGSRRTWGGVWVRVVSRQASGRLPQPPGLPCRTFRET